jgi:hypothetical protein
MDDMSARYCLAAPPRPSRRWLQLGALGTVLAGVCFGAVLAPDASASKRPALGYVSGRLSVSGYTVALVGYDGKATFSRNRSFRLPARDSKLTVQLISKHGVYAGPVVFSSTATRAIVGIKAGTNLGNITVVASKGYAHVTRKLAAKRLDASRWAYAKKGVPLGNGRNLGLIASKNKGRAAGAGLDPAHIGIPNEFNIAVPGTRILKSLAPAANATVRSAATSVTPTAVCPPPPAAAPPSCTPPTGPPGAGNPGNDVPTWMAQMFLDPAGTVNVDAAGVTQAEIDANLQTSLNLKLLNVPATNLVELGCNGLSFCSPDGSGQAVLEGQQGLGGPGPQQTVAFPSGSLDPATGFGELIGPAAPGGLLGADANGSHEFSLNPNATTTQIGSGDVITALSTNNGVTTQSPTTIDFVFTTVPAITAYSDSAGNAGTITYPDSAGLGTQQNPLRVAAGPNGDVVVTFTLFRPQRPGIAGAGEPAFMDIGRLGYELDYVAPQDPNSHTIGSSGSPGCPVTVYSGESSTLGARQGPGGGFGPTPGGGWLVDSSADQPASAQNTISFTADLTQCLASKGTTSFSVGQTVGFDISANSQSADDHANQSFAVERTS